MTIMTENPSVEVQCLMADEDVKCRENVCGATGAAPGGEEGNSSPRESDNRGRPCLGQADGFADRKKKRRRKTKRKAPYSKAPAEIRGRKVLRCVGQKRRYKQPEAPYNSNRFLIEDHNDLKDIDVDLHAAAHRINGENNMPSSAVQRSPQRGRARDSSFTSVESDEDFYYSSPEDEEEFLTKEFSNTYKDLHVETLASLSKAELIQHILSLEERMDTTQKKLEALSQTKTADNTSLSDKVVYFQEEISKLVIANRTLLRENEQLRRQRKNCSGSSEDSESDSSSSTCSSSTTATDSDTSLNRSPVNGDTQSSLTPLMDTDNVT